MTHALAHIKGLISDKELFIGLAWDTFFQEDKSFDHWAELMYFNYPCMRAHAEEVNFVGAIAEFVKAQDGE